MSEGDGSLLGFPCDLPIMVFGRNAPEFRDAVVTIVESHYGSAYSLAEQESKQGSYVSFTITVRAETRTQIDAVYKDLVANELILMAL